MMEEFRTPPEISFEPGPGSRLRQAREAANRSIGEISAALHLDPQMVEALEAIRSIGFHPRRSCADT